MIDLLVALSVIALVTAGVMLASSARAEVQRRLSAFGVRRAIGSSRGFVTLTQAVEGLLVAVPAATLGVLAGFAATAGPIGAAARAVERAARPGSRSPLPCSGRGWWACSRRAFGAAWPAWRAGRGPVGRAAARRRRLRPAGRRRRADARRRPRCRSGSGSSARGGARSIATAVTLGLSAGFVLLVLALASELSTLETDPSALGERYTLTSYAAPSLAGRVARIPGVAAASPRYEVQAADSYALGETGRRDRLPRRPHGVRGAAR